MKVMALFLLACFLGGCAAPADTGAETQVTTITNPNEGRTDMDGQPHLHDYWGNAKSLTLLTDAVQEVPGIVWFSPEPIPVASYRFEPGTVVPQGAAWVNITLSWTDEGDGAALNAYRNPQLFVKTAAEGMALWRADLVENGMTVSLASNNTANDLPHQVLSAWRIELWMTAADEPTGPRLWFEGKVTATVTTDRGLEIPLYPGHPDRWDGRSEIELFSETHRVTFDGSPTDDNYRCYGGCPRIHVPGDGLIVPIDAALVRVTLETTLDAPSQLGLKFHGATSYTFEPVDASSSSPNRRIYDIPVLDMGDGPYSKASQWEFAPYIAFPIEDGFATETYTLTAVALRSI